MTSSSTAPQAKPPMSASMLRSQLSPSHNYLKR